MEKDKELFVSHKADISFHSSVFVLTWANPSSSDHRVVFTFVPGRMYVTGDFGDYTYRNPTVGIKNVADLARLKDLPDSWWEDNFICGRVPLWSWSEKAFKEDMGKWAISKEGRYAMARVQDAKLPSGDVAYDMETLLMHMDDLRELSEQGAKNKQEWEALVNMREYEFEDLQAIEGFWERVSDWGCRMNPKLMLVKEALERAVEAMIEVVNQK